MEDELAAKRRQKDRTETREVEGTVDSILGRTLNQIGDALDSFITGAINAGMTESALRALFEDRLATLQASAANNGGFIIPKPPKPLA